MQRIGRYFDIELDSIIMDPRQPGSLVGPRKALSSSTGVRRFAICQRRYQDGISTNLATLSAD